MVEALFDIGGTRGELVLLAYLAGGLAVFGAAFLPGNTPLYRVVCLILGAVMSVWAAKVMMFGGVVYVNAFVVIAPLVLLVRGAMGTIRSVVARPARPAYAPGHLPPPRPHPAARQFGGPASYQPHPPAAYNACPGHAAPAAYNAYPGHAAPAACNAYPGHASLAATDPWADPWTPRPEVPARTGAHAAQPTGHIPRQPGPRGLEAADPYAGRARHRAS